MKIKEIYDFLDKTAPFNTAADFDNTGLSVGSLMREVKTVLISLDVTNSVIKKAEEIGADLVLTHHPLIFNPICEVVADTPVYNAVRSGITFISSHTCLDKSDGGVNSTLAEILGVKDLYQSELDEFLKIGIVDEQTASEFASKVKTALGGKVSFTKPDKIIKKVALCSGSGGDSVFAAKEAGADALLTGEAKHHELLASNDLDVSLFVAGHFETENIICEKLKCLLSEQFKDLKIEIFSENPVNYI